MPSPRRVADVSHAAADLRFSDGPSPRLSRRKLREAGIAGRAARSRPAPCADPARSDRGRHPGIPPARDGRTPDQEGEELEPLLQRQLPAPPPALDVLEAFGDGLVLA